MLCKCLKVHAKRMGFVGFVSAAAVLLSVAACGQGEDAATKAHTKPSSPQSVTVAEVERRPITTGAEFVGRIEAVDEVAIRARVQGFLKKRLFNVR